MIKEEKSEIKQNNNNEKWHVFSILCTVYALGLGGHKRN
jgi:hypothetical protein